MHCRWPETQAAAQMRQARPGMEVLGDSQMQHSHMQAVASKGWQAASDDGSVQHSQEALQAALAGIAMHVLTAIAAQRTSIAPRARGLWHLDAHLRWDCQTLSLLAPQRPQPRGRQSRLWVCQRRACCRGCQRAHWTLQSPHQSRQRSEPQRLGSTAPQTLEWRRALQMQALRWGLQMQTAARKDWLHVGSGVPYSELPAWCIRLSEDLRRANATNMSEGTVILQSLGCTPPRRGPGGFA